MKAIGKKAIAVLTLFLMFFVFSLPVWALPTTSTQAISVVQGWRWLEQSPLGATLGDSIKEVKTFYDEKGTEVYEVYYVVYLLPSGYVIVSADDLIEPIIAFSPEGIYDPSDQNPLGALVSRDLPNRVHYVRSNNSKTSTSFQLKDAQEKWKVLESVRTDKSYPLGITTVSDVRVSPLIQSKWDQGNYSGTYLYNYYTPNHYVSGCVATAMSQLMRYHQYPTVSVGTKSYTVKVDGASRSEALMGGDGLGGPYNWSSMPLVPDSSITTTQRQAIGRLLHDTGTTVSMQYTSGSSGASTLDAKNALKSAFFYSNAIYIANYSGGSWQNIPTSTRSTILNSNLDAGFPLLLGITGNGGGHEIVADGYGYQSSTLYHHLNMGWSGSNDLWYNLPNIDDSYYGFNVIDEIVYNIYPTGTGEIVSGRVVDNSGATISGATITASKNGTTSMTATTNSAGIYAFKGLSSGTAYTIAASKSGYSFTSQNITTGTSADSYYGTSMGNSWGVNFTGSGSSTCTYSVSPTSALFGSPSGTGVIRIDGTPSGCTGSWTAVSNSSWITITSGSSGTGSGSVTYTISQNTTGTTRTGTITVAGKTHTVTQTTSTREPIYRFYNTHTGGHFFTDNPDERNMVIRDLPDFRWESDGAYYIYRTQQSGASPVYRLFNTYGVGHYYTISETDKDAKIAQGYALERVGFYAFTTQVSGTKPVYYFNLPASLNNGKEAWFYTISEAEKDWIIATYPTIWTYKGIAFYAYE